MKKFPKVIAFHEKMEGGNFDLTGGHFDLAGDRFDFTGGDSDVTDFIGGKGGTSKITKLQCHSWYEYARTIVLLFSIVYLGIIVKTIFPSLGQSDLETLVTGKIFKDIAPFFAADTIFAQQVVFKRVVKFLQKLTYESVVSMYHNSRKQQSFAQSSYGVPNWIQTLLAFFDVATVLLVKSQFKSFNKMIGAVCILIQIVTDRSIQWTSTGLFEFAEYILGRILKAQNGPKIDSSLKSTIRTSFREWQWATSNKFKID